MMPFYRRIITDAWKIAWTHKYLWVFGFFTALVGFGGITEVLFNTNDRVSQLVVSILSHESPFKLIPGFTTLRAVLSFSSSPILATTIFIIIAGLLLAVFFWIATTSIGALIHNVRKIELGGEPTFGDGMKVGMQAFWKILALNLMTKFVIIVTALITGCNLFILIQHQTLTSAFFYVGSFVIFTGVAVIASIITVFASNYVILKNETIMRAIVKGGQLFAEHWLINLEMSIALFVVSIAIGLLAALFALILSVPVIFLFLITIALKASGLVAPLLTLTTIGCILIIVLFASFVTTFEITSWTLLWGEMTENKPMAKLHRLVHHLTSFMK